MIPDTDFPDIRNKTVIHSADGSCMIIPREGDKVRLYVQLLDQDVGPSTGRVDNTRMGAERIIEVSVSLEVLTFIDEMTVIKAAKKILHPFYIRPLTDIEWWTTYISMYPDFHSSIVQYVPLSSRSACGIHIFSRRAYFHRW